ncbi:MAG: M3 family metallopeptidase, partial [Bacteroidales bacterium]|nr:M3 family metallopeptidase [Bacteroidales bacterium]
MKKLLIVMGAALMLASCNSSNVFLQEWDTPYGIPPFDKIKIGDYMPAIKAGIEQQNAEIQAIIDNQEAPSFENTVAAFDRSGALLEKVTNVLFNVSESDYTPELNAIVEEATPVISAHGDNLMMNPKLFERVKAVYEAPQDNLTREQQMLLKDLYEGFVRNGIGLDEAGQARMKEINSELATLALTFGNNLLAQSNAFKDSVGFSVASYYDKMASEADRAQREKIFRLYSNRGNNGDEFDNKATVLRIMELRIEKAKLMGYESPAAFILEDKMAHDPATVDAFLGDIMAAAMRRAKEEVADMQKLMDEDVAAGVLPAGSRIEPWDYMYYAEKVRKARYDLDESEVSQYFKMENVRAGVFGNASRLYGIQFEPISGVPLYNPECEAFKVTDSDGSLIGIIITDYYPRDSKRGGAWMTNFVEQSEGVRPVIVNVGNFNKPTADTPSLLTIDQVETMFHEFGHALHGLLTKCNYKGVSGTNV